MSRAPSPPLEPPATGHLPPLRQPTDTALITDYLRPWLAWGEENFDRTGIGAYMHGENMYAAAPDELTRKFPPLLTEDGETRWYFRTPVFPMSSYNPGGRKSRTAGGGIWHEEGRFVRVFDLQHRVIGMRSLFSFKVKDVATGWIMHEYRVQNEDGVALAKIYRSPRYRGPPAVPDVLAAEAAKEARDHAAAEAAEEATKEARVRAALAEPSSAATGVHAAVPAAAASAAAEPDIRAGKQPEVRAEKDAGVLAALAEVFSAAADVRGTSSSGKRNAAAAALADASSSGKRKAVEHGEAAAVAVDLQCARCGFRLGTLNALVTPPNRNSAGGD